MTKKRVEKILPDDHLPIEEGPGRDELKRLYTISEDEAWSKFDLKGWIKKERESIKTASIDHDEFFKWMAAQDLKSCCERYKNGDKAAIIEGLYLCTQHGLTTPRWLATAFFRAYHEVKGFKAKSWDDVFGKPHARGMHLTSKADMEGKLIPIFMRIRDIKKKNPEKPIDEGFFEEIGKEFQISGSLANKIYYEGKKRYKLLK